MRTVDGIIKALLKLNWELKDSLQRCPNLWAAVHSCPFVLPATRTPRVSPSSIIECDSRDVLKPGLQGGVEDTDLQESSAPSVTSWACSAEETGFGLIQTQRTEHLGLGANMKQNRSSR